MLVKDWMSSPAITIEANAPISQAIKLTAKNTISMLPVVRQGRLVGVVSDMDLKPYSSPQALPDQPAQPRCYFPE